MRTYDARSIALTVGVQPKWVDNLLSHHSLPGVSGGRRGVQRQVSYDGLVAIEVTRMLVAELHVPLWRAAELATDALQAGAGNDLRVTTPGRVTVILPHREIESRLRDGMIAAAESLGRVRRGRPPKDSSMATTD